MENLDAKDQSLSGPHYARVDLCELIGFKTADAIAMKLGIEKTAMIRVRVGISYALTEAMDEGHCGLPTNELVPLAEKLLDVPQRLRLSSSRSSAGHYRDTRGN
jgi:ATP-dependent exoDNAse (exonuclease V) alpha subunit